jgi:molecular chaperone DnaK (HSP70)
MTWQETKLRIVSEGGKLPEDIYIIGVDLGTTNSIISYWDSHNDRPELIDISNGFGKIALPSVVQYRPDGDEWLIGQEAYNTMAIYPQTTIRSIKRKMGTSDTVKINNIDYKPEEISSKILRELFDHIAGINPKAELGGAVVSVPYHFDDAAKKATQRACELAGIKDQLICLIEEPLAAALNYNMTQPLKDGQKIMVFDFGGGTLDITLFRVSEQEGRLKLQVISEGGEAYHGGDNVDEMLTDLCFQIIERKNNIGGDELSPENRATLVMHAREAKERLSGLKSYRVPFAFCIPPFMEQITRETLEGMIQPFMDKTRNLVRKTLRDAYTGAVSPDAVDRVLLEGGSSFMPWVRSMLVAVFNDESKIYSTDKRAQDISLGAAYYAAIKMGLLNQPDMSAEVVQFEVTTPHDIGLEVVAAGGKSFFPMIRRGTPYSLAVKSHAFTLNGSVPDEMTRFNLRILERIDKADPFDKCKLIGEVEMKGLPVRPSGKTKLKITLKVTENGGMVNGIVEDLGFAGEYTPSGYREPFEPVRDKKTVVKRSS